MAAPGATGGERIHEDFHQGLATPFGPRPVILDAWRLARDSGLTPHRGARVVLLEPSELRQRREQSPVSPDSPFLAELVDLAARNDLLAVVLDADDVVLHRGGCRDALAAADRLGYLDGARWDLDHAGVNAAGLGALLGRPVAVNRWEHTFTDQHGLCCLAIPVSGPRGGRVTLNLTATADGLTGIPRPLRSRLHAMARRLHRELRAPGSDHRSS